MRFLFYIYHILRITTVTAILPYPSSIIYHGTSVKLSRTCQLICDVENFIITSAFNRMMGSISNDRMVVFDFEKPHISRVQLRVEDPSTDLQHGVDESYSLEVVPESSSVYISAKTVWGGLHAFTTLQQLITSSFALDVVSIKDTPAYPHRGIMLDSGRNFLTVESILEQIDIMASCKMNVLHWHLVDTQSWPLKLVSHPEMIEDAYSEAEVYLMSDLLYVVGYARQRGVRVIPELDMPGHALAGWRKVDPSMVVCADTRWYEDGTAVQPPPGQLDVTVESTYQAVKDIYKELTQAFSDNMFHLGSDELSIGCYNHSESIKMWLHEHPGKYNQLVDYWLSRTLPLFRDKKERRLIMWEDIVLSSMNASDLPKDIILQSWNEHENVKVLTSKGYDVIISSSSFLYLDCGIGPSYLINDKRFVDSESNYEWNYLGKDSWCGPYKTWQRIYSMDILSNFTKSQQQHVLGYEAPLWSEQVDSLVLTQKIWPRTAALGELAWSGNKDENGELRLEDFGIRLYQFREQLVAEGKRPSPIAPKYCSQNPYKCRM